MIHWFRLYIVFTHLALIDPNKGLKINHDSLVQNIYNIYTLGFDGSKQGSENKQCLEYMFLVTFTFIYFDGFQTLSKIHYIPYSLYKILKGSKISQWLIPPNIIWILKLPSNIWMTIALYPPIVQVVWMFTLIMTWVESNSWDKWKIFKPSEEYESKTEGNKNNIFWSKEIQIIHRFSLVLCYLLQEPL